MEDEVIDRFLECGDPHHGFARIFCDATMGPEAWPVHASLPLTYHPLCTAAHNGCNAECIVMQRGGS